MHTQTLKYTVIKTKDQYLKYCGQLEDLLHLPQVEGLQDEIDLLTLLIENMMKRILFLTKVIP